MTEDANISQVNNRRIAKNTILLYVRTLFTLLISLYTSRVILAQLGVEDYGVYNVVGGVVGMFSVISSALSSAISRFITFELGRGDTSKLRKIFSTSVNIQFGISLVVLILAEIIGVWFLNNKMSIPDGRMTAANWVLQCSLVTFCVNLISVPYNACIIAHEKMTAYAYFSILEVCLKLGICFLLSITIADKLITYSFLMLGVAIIIRLTYGFYCHHKFEESHYQMVFYRNLFKEMTSFAGWNFVSNTVWVFNTQGVNLLTNVYFGVVFNAARGVATQVESLVNQFVFNFTTAIGPQITKSYANNEKEEMFRLMCRGAKYSFLLFYILALPVFFEVDFLLSIWLKVVPEYSLVFTRFSLICSMLSFITHPFYYGCMATGNIKKYVITVSLTAFLVFPLSWLCFAIGLPAYWSYISFIIAYVGVNLMCLYNTKWLLGFPLSMFVSNVLKPIAAVSMISCIIPLLIIRISFSSEVLKAIVVIIVCVLSVAFSSYFLGMERNERKAMLKMVKGFLIK